MGTFVNTVEITKTSNLVNYTEQNEEDNISRAEMVIAIKTGDIRKVGVIVSRINYIIINVCLLSRKKA